MVVGGCVRQIDPFLAPVDLGGAVATSGPLREATWTLPDFCSSRGADSCGQHRNHGPAPFGSWQKVRNATVITRRGQCKCEAWHWTRHGNKPTTRNRPPTRAVPAPREWPARGRQEITDAQADARKQETRQAHGLFLSSAPETKTNWVKLKRREGNKDTKLPEQNSKIQ